MRKTFFFLLAASSLLGTAFAYEMSSCPVGSGCDRCFHDTLQGTNTSTGYLIPRAWVKEQVDTATSTIFAEAFQWVSVTPIGDIKPSFSLNGGPSTTTWAWATMNGSLIVKWTVPSSIDYVSPVYRIRYTTKSYTVDSNNQKNTGTDLTYNTCSYFYIDAPVSQATNGQCSSLDTFYVSNPKNSSLSGETLCTRGASSSVTYSSANERWSYTCYGTNGWNNDSCIVDLDANTDPSCRIEVTDTTGTVPFDSSFSCSGNPQWKTALVISRSGTIIDAFEWDTQSYTFDDSGTYSVSCYPDVVNDRSNVCKKTVSVSGDCGNGTEESDEQCDDGNTASGDGCSHTCQLEWDNGAVCGNGAVETGEQCDDGNIENGDECTSLCQDTAPDTGPVSALLATLLLALVGAGYSLYRKSKIVA